MSSPSTAAMACASIPAPGNAIVNNSIFSNGLMGIDLVPGGTTPNDPGDTDTGSNTLINWPVLSSARTVGANVLVQVALSPTPVGQFQVHYYANTTCDPTGNGEGQTPIGVSSGTGNGNDANLEASFPSSLVPAGSFITATMTDSGGNTSEFSPCALVDGSPGSANLGITQQDSPDPVDRRFAADLPHLGQQRRAKRLEQHRASPTRCRRRSRSSRRSPRSAAAPVRRRSRARSARSPAARSSP